ncbi:MAG TPA: ABC transporter ATP-binding protein [Candidatus Sumerlaeota bacterium]|nr:ABC transporter ATP-binding protein [Candidatus Sumerlaeota bacterium]
MAPVIEIKGLSKTYVQDFIGVEHGRLKIRFKNRRRIALKPLDLTVEEGEIFGLLGPNGAGKTTTIKMLMGLHFPTSGEARIMGKPLGDNSVKEKIGFMPENAHFYDYLTGHEFLDYYGQLYGMPKELRRKRIPELLEKVGLSHAGELPLRGYSKGMQQRVGLAQSLLNDPKIVFLDEPQSGLDPFGRKEVRDLILSLRDAGKTVFFSSHILQDAELICDRVAILHKGQRIALGPLSEMLSAKVKEYEVAFSDAEGNLVEHAQQRAVRFVQRPNEYLAQFEREEDARALVQEILSGRAKLNSFIARKETLEEYFIREIESKQREEKAAAVAGGVA